MLLWTNGIHYCIYCGWLQLYWWKIWQNRTNACESQTGWFEGKKKKKKKPHSTPISIINKELKASTPSASMLALQSTWPIETPTVLETWWISSILPNPHGHGKKLEAHLTTHYEYPLMIRETPFSYCFLKTPIKRSLASTSFTPLAPRESELLTLTESWALAAALDCHQGFHHNLTWTPTIERFKIRKVRCLLRQQDFDKDI